MIKKNTNKKLDVVFSRIRSFSFQKNLRQKPKGVTHKLSLCLVIQRSMRVTPLGFCLRTILNKIPLNLERTTSRVLSLLCFMVVSLSWLKINFVDCLSCSCYFYIQMGLVFWRKNERWRNKMGTFRKLKNDCFIKTIEKKTTKTNDLKSFCFLLNFRTFF